jgi:hypothetical protein
MTSDTWTVNIIGQAKKADKNLSEDAAKAFVLLLKELKSLGPCRFNWPNYTKMNGKEDYHCHLKKGRPTYAACWIIKNKNQKIIEVYYAGTHEKAPY